MYRTQDLRDALSQVDDYVDDIIEMITEIKDKSESYHDDMSQKKLEELLDEIYSISVNCLSAIK